MDPNEAHELITVGELSKRSGVKTSALRFYEELGLIHSQRTDANHRRYPRATLRKVAFIVFAQRIGFSLEEIGGELAKLVNGAGTKPERWARLSSSWSARVEEKIGELMNLRRGIEGCIGCGCLSQEKCRLANPNDRLAALGPGPAMWNTVPDKRSAVPDKRNTVPLKLKR